MTHRLPDLPDDILFLVLANLECTRDFRALALSCRRLHRLVSSDGWRIFVRTKFPSLAVPAPAAGSRTWRQLAESMTWQSRCWDKRSLQFHVLLPRQEFSGHGRRYGDGLGGFMSVVDAHLDLATQQELVVWGAGEDIHARYRERQGRGKASKVSWHKLGGNDSGLRGGYDDVKTLKVVKHGGSRAIIAGRHNGELSLLSAEPNCFGERIAQLGPVTEQNTSSQQLSEPDTINSLDIFQSSSGPLLAAAAKTTLRIYGLPEDDAEVISPLSTYDLRDNILFFSSARLGAARWLDNGDTIAMALVGCKDPLRYLARTPTGWSHHAAAKNERMEKEFGASFARTVTPNSLEPVHYLQSGARRGTSLLLSSWKDGTIRLQDLRTPSPFDGVYQDNVDPWSNAESLMAYGTERFVAGGADGLTIQVFDFRWPKAYYHTSGLPCLGRSPFPRPHQPFMKPPVAELQGGVQCDHVMGRLCRWHTLSQNLYFRPNAKFFLSNSLRQYKSSSVWSLARPSDVSPNFYIGLTGGVIEATLEQTPDTYPPNTATVDPNFGFDDWRAGVPAASGYKGRLLLPALMETGDGYSYKGNDRSILLPALNRYHGPAEWMASRGSLAKHHRLDNGYQEETDFMRELS
ncbi:hypothetical protein C7999DRAFT_12591 [Corynascus novoguineensis]|uniref:F-box domain-containing protein n=1 Tax=Corynascus novoguineensis TaxID=1126955 RepID=A0AAN7HH17_9PEZI|nr:hypothetical protein C7999DRAFT_12591 [Corynascus novoguineensis]